MTRTRTTPPLAVLFVLLALAAGGAPRAAAEIVAGEPGGERGRSAGPTAIDQRIIDFEMWRMTQDLRLSDEQAARIFPKMRRLGEVRASARRQRGALMRELKARNQRGDAAGAEQLTGKIREHDAATSRDVRALEDDVYSELSREQQGQYLIFRERFNHEMRNYMEKARQGRGGGGGGGGRRGRGR